MLRHRVHGVENTSPLIDFEKETVLGVFAGAKPTKDYSVEILNVYRTDLGAKVIYKIVGESKSVDTNLPSPSIVATRHKVAGKNDAAFENKTAESDKPIVTGKTAVGSRNAEAAKIAASASQPYVLIKIPKLQGPVQFIRAN